MPRIIYSLQLELKHPDNPEALVELIAPLSPDGQSPHCRACLPKSRVVDLRVGDLVQHGGKRYCIKKVAAYRDVYADELHEQPQDGYVVRSS